MKSHTIILLYIVAECVCDQINRHEYSPTSDVYNQSKVHVKQDDHHKPEQQCPDAEDIAPCTCTYNSVSNAIDLNCSAVESEEQLKQIFKADFPFKNFREFRIEDNNNIKVLEAAVFNGISFEKIDIEHNHLEVIELQALNSCYETATVISLKSNNITSFPFDELSQFSKLSYLYIRENSLSMIPADAFHGLTALEYLDISVNHADIVGTFQDLPNLRYIELSSNALTTIPAHFSETGSSNLSYIGLAGNSIVSVEPGAFDIVDGLNIDMWYNSLSTLEEATWRPNLEAGGTLRTANNPWCVAVTSPGCSVKISCWDRLTCAPPALTENTCIIWIQAFSTIAKMSNMNPMVKYSHYSKGIKK